MAREITDIASAHARQLHDEAPWIWLYDIEVPTEPKTRYRLTNYTSPVEYGTTSGGIPLVYSPFPIVHSDLTQTIEGDLPQLQLQVGGASRELATVLDEHSGLVGSPCVVRLVNSEDLNSTRATQELRGVVISCQLTNERTTLVIGSRDLASAQVPPLRFVRSRCTHRYGGPACGYDLTNNTLLTAFPTCARGYEACVAHGDAEVAAGLARKHPARFGGWPGIPRF